MARSMPSATSYWPRAPEKRKKTNVRDRPLTILTVAFPFAPVGPNSVGGAEQIASALDSSLCAAGHRSIVIAADDSEVAGKHIKPGFASSELASVDKGIAWKTYKQIISDALASEPIELVHMHGIDFDCYLPNTDLPILVTLHLPPQWYPKDIFSAAFQRNVWLQCVSQSQLRTCPDCDRLLAVVENGVPAFDLCGGSKQNFALMLGRICPEKGFEIGMDAAKQAGLPALLAGAVFPYETHLRYFREAIIPRLDSQRRFVGPLGVVQKRKLLCEARCVVVPSLAPETSSLTAMEAAMAGTPVIAFPSGALSEVIEHGRTGYLVSDVDEMARAIQRAQEIDSRTCRERALKRFQSSRMIREYFDLYQDIAANGIRGGS